MINKTDPLDLTQMDRTDIIPLVQFWDYVLRNKFSTLDEKVIARYNLDMVGKHILSDGIQKRKEVTIMRR